jgi:hypothetical protein
MFLLVSLLVVCSVENLKFFFIVLLERICFIFNFIIFLGGCLYQDLTYQVITFIGLIRDFMGLRYLICLYFFILLLFFWWRLVDRFIHLCILIVVYEWVIGGED